MARLTNVKRSLNLFEERNDLFAFVAPTIPVEIVFVCAGIVSLRALHVAYV